MESNGSWIVAAILTAEVAFWVVLFLGLSARYLVRMRRTSTALLVGVPLIDLLLLVFVVADLARGAAPAPVHGLAAVYLGFSVGFGHYIIGRVDAWFAHRFAGGPRPRGIAKSGPAKIRHEWQSWGRVVVAWAIAVAALLLMKVIAGWSIPTTMAELWGDELWAWIARLTAVNVIWFLTGPLYAVVFLASAEPQDARAGSRD